MKQNKTKSNKIKQNQTKQNQINNFAIYIEDLTPLDAGMHAFHNHFFLLF